MQSSQIAMWARLSTLIVWGGAIVLTLIFPPFFVLALCAFIPPRIFRSKWPNDRLVRHHATQALNTSITDLIFFFAFVIIISITIATFSIIGLGFAALIYVAALAIGITRIVYEIIGAVRASNGQFFHLPLWLAFRFAKDNDNDNAMPPGGAS